MGLAGDAFQFTSSGGKCGAASNGASSGGVLAPEWGTAFVAVPACAKVVREITSDNRTSPAKQNTIRPDRSELCFRHTGYIVKFQFRSTCHLSPPTAPVAHAAFLKVF